ncbi:hypothetical protein SAY87_020191 [Trapa incisa]|uniref:GDSL esterase/lipase n=1 Tax=Trapa incisa TaxID=236973 RepID=A0AAN7K9E7_9MYRT|nr:hypothetical protein SAY87_020191 [Trapa incisa]
MASFRLPRFLLLVSLANIAVVIHPVGTLAKSKNAGQQKHKPFFVFGDSAFDPGNYQYLDGVDQKGPLAYAWPYGQHFSSGAIGRHSHGRIVPDFIADNANLGLIPPCLAPGVNFINGVNFASAGAGVFTDNSGAMNMEQQMRKFEEVRAWFVHKLGAEPARKTLKRAVYLFGFGSKEYLSLYLSGRNTSKSSQRKYAEMVVGNITDAFLEIYNAGGRKFGFQNVGPLGCLPMLRATESSENADACVEELNSMARKHNKALAGTLKRLGSLLPGLKHSIFDYYGALMDRIHNATKYGLEEGKEPCYRAKELNGGMMMNWEGNNWMEQYMLCQNSSLYVFFDGIHTTEAVNSQLAELMWDGPSSITQPSTLKQFFQL